MTTTTTEPCPIHDAVLADLGPLVDAVDTEYCVLEAQAVLAMAGRAP